MNNISNSQELFCTYLTTYSGNKLPLFYIGSSSVERVNNGYHGSVKSKAYSTIWKSELKHNPHLFKTRILYREYLHTDPEIQKKKSISMTEENNPRFDKPRTDIERSNISIGVKLKYENDPEYRKRNEEKAKGSHWYNNGEISIMRFECPEGFIAGRLPFRKSK